MSQIKGGPQNEARQITSLRGVKARRFRSRWAAASLDAQPHLQTIRFPLEIPPNFDVDINALSTLNRVLRDTAPGSVPWLLIVVHASGFRVFSKADEVVAFQNSGLLGNSSYQREFGRISGIASKRLDPANLYIRFRQVPRESHPVPFTAAGIADHYSRYFLGKALTQAEPCARLLFEQLGSGLQSLGSWAEIARDPVRAFGAWDHVMMSLGFELPALSLRARRLRAPPVAVAKATIAYDAEKRLIPLEPAHALYLVVADALAKARSEGLQKNAPLTRRVQQLLLSDNYSGLSWLFGSGLRTLKSATPTECARWFGAPEENVQQIVEAAVSIAPDTVFGERGYAAYRALVGGELASWISNYVERLEEMQALLLTSCPAVKSAPNVPPGLVPAELSELMRLQRAASRGVEDATSAVRFLSGIAEPALTQHISTLKKYSELDKDLRAALSVRRVDPGLASQKSGDTPLRAAFAPPLTTPLPTLNAVPKAESPLDELEAATAELLGLQQRMRTHAEQMLAQFPDGRIHGLTIAESYFTRAAAKSDKEPMPRAEQVARLILDRFGRVARVQPTQIVREVMQVYEDLGVFINLRTLHKYFINRQGRLTPSSRSTEPVLPVSPTLAGKSETILPTLGMLLKRMEDSALDITLDVRRWVALLELTHAYYSILLLGLPARVPSVTVQPSTGMRAALSATFELALREPWIEAQIARRLFGLHRSRIRKVASICTPEQSYARYQFSRSRDNVLLYVPRNRMWRVPDRLLSHKPHSGLSLRELGHTEPELASPWDLLPKMIAVFGKETAARNYLVQAPHDWYYAGMGQGAKVEGLPISKVGAGKRTSRANALRLTGPSSFRSVVDKAQLQQSGSIGDIQVILENSFSHSIRREDGAYRIHRENQRWRVYLGLPVRTKAMRTDEAINMDRYLCAWLCERGVGWAVFGSRTHLEIANGFLRVGSLPSLLASVNGNRRPIVRSRRLGARYDKGMENARARVAGEFLHVINSALSTFKAFPVLAFPTGSTDQAGVETSRVHRLVVEKYTFDKDVTTTSRRRSFWQGGSLWIHPYLMQCDSDGRGRPLHLFPGVLVSSTGTVEACCKCRRNPLEALRLLERSGIHEIAVSCEGTIEVGNGALKLKNIPVSGLVELNTIQRAVKAQMHEASNPEISQLYKCLYWACAASAEVHINAVRNMATKFQAKLCHSSGELPSPA